MTARDPLRDPRVGDVVRPAEHLPYHRANAVTIVGRRSGVVIFRTGPWRGPEQTDGADGCILSLYEYRRWVRGGTVLEVAP